MNLNFADFNYRQKGLNLNPKKCLTSVVVNDFWDVSVLVVEVPYYKGGAYKYQCDKHIYTKHEYKYTINENSIKDHTNQDFSSILYAFPSSVSSGFLSTVFMLDKKLGILIIETFQYGNGLLQDNAVYFHILQKLVKDWFYRQGRKK